MPPLARLCPDFGEQRQGIALACGSPFRKRIFSLRVYRAEPPAPYLLGDLSIGYAERRVRVAGRPVQLTATEYDWLHQLSVNAGRVLTHDQLLQRVWGLGWSAPR